MNRAHAVWFAILTALCLAVGFGIWKVRLSRSETQTVAPLVTRSPEEIEQVWKTGVQAALQTYEQDKDVAKARNALIALTVPAGRRDLHLALVLALEGLQQQRPDAPTRWQKASADFMAIP